MSTFDLIFEIGTEEIPAGFVPPALTALESIARKSLVENRIEFGDATVCGTARRLVLHVTGMAENQPDIVEEAMGPSVNVAFDSDGNPTKAGMGFARSRGVDVSDLKRVQTDKGEYIAVSRKVIGRASKEVLTELLPAWIRALPFKKSMRWGSGETAFARPVHWILALAGSEVIDIEFAGAKSSNFSKGHRFHAPDKFEVTDANDYFEKIAKAHVIVDPAKRKQMIAEQVNVAAAEVGGKVIEDDELLDIINYLVEEPTAVAGGYDSHFLELPEELLILSMKTHQKYFAVVDDSGKLMNHFVTVSNTRARDMSVVARGNERVLRARLADARFFYDEDQKKTLEQHAEGLKNVVFQRKLGTSFEKVERFTKIADRLSAVICPDSADKVERIAKLCKADLVTMMVYEFPEIQGIVGREYALRAGEDKLVAQGIQDHYKPVQAGDDLPGSPEADCVSLGDKLDTITGCFGVGLIPSGTADPYALRRQTIGILRIILEKGYRLTIADLIDMALGGLSDKLTRDAAEVKSDVTDFFRGRFEVLLGNEGFSGDAIQATLAAGFDDVVDARARVQALQAVKDRGELAPLAGTFKRAANILKKAADSTVEVDPALFQDEAEKNLWSAYGEVRKQMTGAVEKGDYEAFLVEAAKLKVVVDAFFDDVMVMTDDEKLRANRIALIGAVTSLFNSVADFTRIGS